MAKAADTDVLLETVAQTSHVHPKAFGIGDGQAPCNLDGY